MRSRPGLRRPDVRCNSSVPPNSSQHLGQRALPDGLDQVGVDGRVFERFSKIQFVNERNVGRVWSFRDITERRRTEEALRDETRILELLNKTGSA